MDQWLDCGSFHRDKIPAEINAGDFRIFNVVWIHFLERLIQNNR
jgi:hypothetical protein